MTMLSEIGEDARLLALLLEALESALKILVVMDYDFRQILLPPFVAFAAPADRYRNHNLVERATVINFGWEKGLRTRRTGT